MRSAASAAFQDHKPSITNHQWSPFAAALASGFRNSFKQHFWEHFCLDFCSLWVLGCPTLSDCLHASKISFRKKNMRILVAEKKNVLETHSRVSQAGKHIDSTWHWYTLIICWFKLVLKELVPANSLRPFGFRCWEDDQIPISWGDQDMKDQKRWFWITAIFALPIVLLSFWIKTVRNCLRKMMLSKEWRCFV